MPLTLLTVTVVPPFATAADAWMVLMVVVPEVPVSKFCGGTWQIDWMQICPPVQALAHPPQLLESFERSTQAPLHTAGETPGQVQVELAHRAPVAHTLLQAPQFATSLVRLAQYAGVPTAGHGLSGLAHDAWQVPLLQICPAVQATPVLPVPLPQPAVAPQCVRLELGSTHCPLHTI